MIFLGSINISNMLKFLGHARFMYETKNEMLLMDPWMSKEGAFDSSWYQFPSNHSLGDEIRNEIESTEKEVYIWGKINDNNETIYDERVPKKFAHNEKILSVKVGN